MTLKIILLAFSFLTLFAFGELFYHKFHWKAEKSRKFVHVSVGLLALSFPLLFDVLWPVLLLCGTFLLILVFSIRFSFLPSINKVQRKTIGSVLFPIIVVVCFWVNILMESSLYYYLPIIIMAVCDPIAAMAGNAKKLNQKSFRGSFAFFVSALFITLVLLSFNDTPGVGVALAVAIPLAAATTLAEFFSKKGWDNFSIPATAVAVLYVMENIYPWR